MKIETVYALMDATEYRDISLHKTLTGAMRKADVPFVGPDSNNEEEKPWWAELQLVKGKVVDYSIQYWIMELDIEQ